MIKLIKLYFYKFINKFHGIDADAILSELNNEKSYATQANETATQYYNNNVNKLLTSAIEKIDAGIECESRRGRFKCKTKIFDKLDCHTKQLLKKHYRKQKFKVYMTPFILEDCVVKISWRKVH